MIKGSARSRSISTVSYTTIRVSMKQETKDTIEPALCWVPISAMTAPLMSSNGPTNIHEYHSRALPMNAGFDTPPNMTKSHETTPAQSRPTTSRKTDMEDRVIGRGLSWSPTVDVNRQ